MLDKDLAELYQVTTGNLNKAVKRNIKRFPPDFMFQLTTEEWEALRFQNGIIKKGRGEHTKYLPYAFTEQGLAMLSGVLNSDIAINVNISIMRAFVAIRQGLPQVSNNKELEELKARMKELEEAIKKVTTGEKKACDVFYHQHGKPGEFVSQGFMSFLTIKPALCYAELPHSNKFFILENNEELMWLVNQLKDFGYYPLEELLKKEKEAEK